MPAINLYYPNPISDIMPITLRQRLINGIARMLRVRLYKPPVELEDTEGKIYVWSMSSTEDAQQMAEFIEDSFIKAHGRSPKALHIVVTDVNVIDDIDPKVLMNKLKPWLDSRREG